MHAVRDGVVRYGGSVPVVLAVPRHGSSASVSALDPFGEVMMLGEWPVMLPAYRVEHCRVQPNWEKGRLLSMHAHLKPGMVLYDVGAEHADLSALYATWLKRTVRGDEYVLKDGAGNQVGDPIRDPDVTTGGVVLVEGSEKFWPVIKATFAANNLTPLGCWAGFASDVDSNESERTPSWATPSFTDGKTWPSWADGDPEPHHGFRSVVESGRTLPNITFDTLSTMAPLPDALTIDVEGAELLVLKGSTWILREKRPLVWVSIHPTLIAHDYPESGVLGTGDPDYERQRVLDFMHLLGYRYIFIEANHEEHFVFWPKEREDFDPYAGIEYLRDA